MAGFGLLLCMPGAPTFFYGDEIGLTGDSSEQARRTMPWNHDEWDDEILAWYRSMIAVRNEHPALRTGGFRWVHTEPDAVVFLRETSDQRLLVRCARASTELLELSGRLLRSRRLRAVVNADDLVADGDIVTLEGEGPVHQIWELQ